MSNISNEVNKTERELLDNYRSSVVDLKISASMLTYENGEYRLN